MLCADVVKIVENWQFRFLFFFEKSIDWIFAKNIYKSHLESGQCYITKKKIEKKYIKYLQKEDNQMVLHKKKQDGSDENFFRF